MTCGNRRDGAAPNSGGFFLWFVSMVSCDFLEGLVDNRLETVELVRCRRP